MRIQHNILAMNAYRNYTNNTSALSKNLEKLSSGYKINRAGDDAAGLAISEKMRAQITGLNAAQKNVKDGISLVKTAEGAMQEIHDMLNRMDYLATQSANGTYDDPVDRANLQKEVDALKTEINRIADSANFNGIKLLDGSLSKDGIASIKSQFELPDVGLVLGKDTVLHRDEDETAASTAFGLELHNVKFTGKKDDQFTIEIGGTKITGTLQEDMDGSDLAHTLKGEDMVAGLLGDTSKVAFTDEAGNAIDPAKITIAGKEYNMVQGVTKPSGTTEGTGVLFQLNEPETDVNVSMDVKVYAGTDPDAAAGTGETTTGAISGTATTDAVVVPAVGGMTGTGKTNAAATVSEHKSNGIVKKGQFNLAKTDGTGGAADTNPIKTVTSGTVSAVPTQSKTSANYSITLDDTAIKAAINTLIAGGTAVSATDKVTLAYNNTSGNFELKVGTNTLGTIAKTAITTYGTAANEAGGLFSITATDPTGGTGTLNAGTDWAADASIVADAGLSFATITPDNFADADQQAAFTKAAVAAGAGSGDVHLVYDGAADAGKRVQLQVGGVTIGTADENQLNNTTTLSFKSADGTDIGSITLAGNGELTGADLIGLDVDTGLTYTDARVNVTSVGTVDHEKLAAAVKAAMTTAGKDIGDGKLDVTFDGTDMKLMLGDTQIGANATVTGGVVTFANAGGDTLFTVTLSDNTLANFGSLAGDSTTIFEDIGPTISINDVTKNTTDTTDLAGSTDLSTVVNEVAKAAGVTLADGTELTVSYNADAAANHRYELKAGDLVVGYADEATGLSGTNGDELTLTFTGTDGAATGLGDVVIKGLKADFAPADLQGEIATGITFDADATPATTGSFTLDNDKLKEFAEGNDAVTAGQNVVAKYNAAGDWTLSFSDGTTDTQITTGTLSADGKTVDFGDYGTVTLSDAFVATGADSDAIDTGLSYGETSFKSGLKGDFLVTTSDQQNTSQTAGDRLASTVLTLKDDMITDGASIFVAGKNYTFSTGDDTVMPEGAVKVDISDLDAEKLGDGYMSAVAKRLTDAYAANNTGVYTLGWNGKNVTVTETVTHGNLKSDGSNDATYPKDDEWDLRTMDGIAKSLGYSSAATEGKALTLQIGDTSDAFNQMQVSVGDMHTAAMGSEDAKIAGIDISTREGASAAVGVIKDAINYVSSIRGDLGATQNRLEHTANNLSVMAENIQDAESTIRDTDIAEEMMAYTKNNILIQSAQAMLAQANAVPQGVLQLLG